MHILLQTQAQIDSRAILLLVILITPISCLRQAFTDHIFLCPISLQPRINLKWHLFVILCCLGFLKQCSLRKRSTPVASGSRRSISTKQICVLCWVTKFLGIWWVSTEKNSPVWLSFFTTLLAHFQPLLHTHRHFVSHTSWTINLMQQAAFDKTFHST